VISSETTRERGKDWKIRLRVDGVAGYDSYDRIGCVLAPLAVLALCSLGLVLQQSGIGEVQLG
jgi:hypothetical protein